MMKIKARSRRRKDGTFEAFIQDAKGNELWKCDHQHNYGTSNRVKQDSASKCAFAKVRELRNGDQKA